MMNDVLLFRSLDISSSRSQTKPRLKVLGSCQSIVLGNEILSNFE